jgi:hypothetical protein
VAQSDQVEIDKVLTKVADVFCASAMSSVDARGLSVTVKPPSFANCAFTEAGSYFGQPGEEDSGYSD